MSGFFYFLPGAKGATSRKKLEAYGLSHIIEHGDTFVEREVTAGIGRAPGVIVGNAKNFIPQAMKFSDEIKWHPFPKNHAQKQAHCGYIDLPGPADLARNVVLDGKTIDGPDGSK